MYIERQTLWMAACAGMTTCSCTRPGIGTRPLSVDLVKFGLYYVGRGILIRAKMST